MFKFRDFRSEKLAAWEKAEIADKKIEKISTKFKLEYSTLLDNLFTLVEVNSFKCIEDIAHIFELENQRVRFVISSYNQNSKHIMLDLEGAFHSLKNYKISPETSKIPYIAWSFPEDYDNPHGVDWQHVHIFFVTVYKDFEAAEECVAYYINKYNDVISFI